MWELDCEEGWVLKNWFFWTVVLDKTLESPLDCKEIQPVHPKGDQSWVFIVLSRCFLTSYFCIPVPYIEKDIFFGVLVLKGLVGLHRTVQLQFLQHYWLGHRFGLLWYWMVCLWNRDHSVLFEVPSKYCISDSFVDHDGYFISSKGFLPTVVDIMVIWVKFTHSSPF